MNKSNPLFAVIVCLAVAACDRQEATLNNIESETAAEESPTVTEESSAAAETPVTDLAPLVDSEWRLINLCGDAMPEGAGVSLSFSKDGAIAGRASVNRYNGAFRFEDGELIAGPFMVTRMAGPPEAMEREHAYLVAIEAAKGVAKSADGELLIHVEGKELPLRFVAVDTP